MLWLGVANWILVHERLQLWINFLFNSLHFVVYWLPFVWTSSLATILFLSSFVLAVVYAIITQVANLIFVHERLQLTKQTNIQATGVASSLVQIIEQAGFKMQALSLGFDEDDDEDDEFIDYDPSTYVEEEEVIAA
jgi:hypothetical protein